MTLLKNTKIMGALVIGLATLGILYFYWGGDSAAEPVATVEEPVASQSLLTTLSNLRTMRLDTTIFEDPLFRSLSDFGVTIPPEPVGRRNPFAPTGVQ